MLGHLVQCVMHPNRIVFRNCLTASLDGPNGWKNPADHSPYWENPSFDEIRRFTALNIDVVRSAALCDALMQEAKANAKVDAQAKAKAKALAKAKAQADANAKARDRLRRPRSLNKTRNAKPPLERIDEGSGSDSDSDFHLVHHCKKRIVANCIPTHASFCSSTRTLLVR